MGEPTSASACGTPQASPWLAYVLLWFPHPTETFLFREIEQLEAQHLPVRIFTLYGKHRGNLSQAMRDFAHPVERFGCTAFLRVLLAFLTTLFRHPFLTCRLVREGLLRRMRDAEAQLENMWAFFAGFLLARHCQKEGIRLLHAPWANGPATATWIASRLTGIPFAFTGRAGDMYPPDGILHEKARDAIVIRTNNAANVDWLARFCPHGQERKVRLVYNALTFAAGDAPAVHMQPTWRIISVGRFVPKKGFDVLLTAMARLRREHVPVHLTLVGDGFLRRQLLALRERLHLEDCVDMPGFLPHEQWESYCQQSDLLVVPSVVDGEDGNRDGIPNVIMEALARSLPVVATDVCGIGEVISNNETGLLVPQRDATALADAIRTMCDDREAAVRMAHAGRDRVLEMFDREHNTRALCELYRGARDAAEGRHAA